MRVIVLLAQLNEVDLAVDAHKARLVEIAEAAREPAALVVNPNSSSTQTVNLVSTTIFTLDVTDQVTGCIGQTDEVIVQIEGGPLAVIIDPDKPAICKGETAILTAYPSGGNQGNYTYTWSDNVGNSYPSSPQIIVSPVETLVFHVIIDDGFNQVEAFHTLEVYPSVAFDWGGGPESFIACPYDSVVLIPEPHPAGWNYLWSDGSVEDHITVKVTGIGFSLQTYTLTTTSDEGCTFSKSATVIFDFSYCFGIGEKNQDPSVRVIPNPSKGRFKVEMDNPTDFSELIVYSPVSGKVFEKIISGNNKEINIDLQHLPAGLYILHLKGPASLVTRKVLIRP